MPELEANDLANDFDFADPDELDPDTVIPEVDVVDSRGIPINQQSVVDLLINTDVLLDHEETQQMARR